MRDQSSTRARSRAVVRAAVVSGILCASAVTHAAPRSVYMMGNSMTDGTGYTGVSEMLKRNSTGINWGRQTGAGWSIYQNYSLADAPFTSGRDVKKPGITNPWGNYTNAFKSNWDVLTLQPTDRRLSNDPKDVGTPDQHNEANVPSALSVMKSFSVNSPKGQVFIYSRPSRRNDVTQALQPTGETFDYSEQWTKPYVDIGASANSNYFTRSYARQMMPLMRTAQNLDKRARGMPDVRVIPVGEAYYNIDQMIKAGDFAGTGVDSMLDFYIDQSHPTANLASYVIGLTFFSSITGLDPRGVDAPTSYLQNNSPLTDHKVQTLLQEAVFGAMRYGGYAGYTAPIAPAGRVLGEVSADGPQTSDDFANGLGIVPEPASLLTLVAGAVFLLRRRGTDGRAAGHQWLTLRVP